MGINCFLEKIVLPLHNKSCLTERKATHIAEFATVSKSLPRSMKNAHK